MSNIVNLMKGTSTLNSVKLALHNPLDVDLINACLPVTDYYNQDLFKIVHVLYNVWKVTKHAGIIKPCVVLHEYNITLTSQYLKHIIQKVNKFAPKTENVNV